MYIDDEILSLVHWYQTEECEGYIHEDTIDDNYFVVKEVATGKTFKVRYIEGDDWNGAEYKVVCEVKPARGLFEPTQKVITVWVNA